MRIVNGKKFYKKDIDAAKPLDFNGWDSYDGRNHQWYSVHYNPECGLVILYADNSGDCYGDYKDRYFASPQKFAEWVRECTSHSLSKLFGDVDESDEVAMKFVSEIYPDA